MWPFGAWLGLTTSEQAFDREMARRMKLPGEVGKFLLPGYDGVVDCYTHSETKSNAILMRLLPEHVAEADPASHGLVTHEASHVVDFIFEACDEAAEAKHFRAYLLQAVVGWVEEELRLMRDSGGSN
jgi:hypothetical protein